MLNFKDNFFFAKFTILFFILTIFGYWGIDLNSEELYIAFSFFLLVVVGVILSRKALLVIFIQSVNAKYFRLLNDLLVAVSALTLSTIELKRLDVSLSFFLELLTFSKTYLISHLSSDNAVLSRILRAKTALFSAVLPLSALAFFYNLGAVKKFHSFGDLSSNYFPINIK